MENNILAFIPARSGSKGLIDKNIKLLGGIPLIGHTIHAAKQSGIFKDIIVSTDSVEYQRISIEYGTNVPFLRPEFLSTDTSTTMDMIEYTLNELDWRNNYDTVVILQPTSPLRTTEDIINAYELFKVRNVNAVVGVTEMEHSPLWCNQIDSNTLSMDGFIKNISSNRQSLDQFYRINGAIYMAKIDYLLKYKDWYHDKSIGYIMDKESSIDIDDKFDLDMAEFFYLRRENSV